jgi:hypothetical protein
LSYRQRPDKKKENRPQPKRVTVNLFIEEDIVNKIRKDAEEKE